MIKKFDKGGGICLLNRVDYVTECHRQLSDINFYRTISHDPTIEFQETVTNELMFYCESGEITQNELDFMLVKCPVIPTFYYFPKIHKQIIPPPGRPIVAAIDSVTCNISTFIDHHIKTYVTLAPSYVKDTSHMVTLINNIDHIPEHSILASFDIVSLYTNIPQVEGLEVLQSTLDNTRDPNLKPSNDCLQILHPTLKKYVE